MKIIVYKNTKTTFGKGIILKQRLLRYFPYAKYSHIEIMFEEEEIKPYLNKIKELEDAHKDAPVCFSASEVDKGVRFKRIELKERNWDIIDIDLSKEQIDKAINECLKLEGLGYNYIGIVLAQLLNLNFKGSNSYFCSEIVVRILQSIHYADDICYKDAVFVFPAQITKMLMEKEIH